MFLYIFYSTILSSQSLTKHSNQEKLHIAALCWSGWTVTLETVQCFQFPSEQWLTTSLLDRSCHHCHCHREGWWNQVTAIHHWVSIFINSGWRTILQSWYKVFLRILFNRTFNCWSSAQFSYTYQYGGIDYFSCNFLVLCTSFIVGKQILFHIKLISK